MKTTAGLINKKKIAFIGTGNMAQAILKGIMDQMPELKGQIYVSNRTSKKAADLADRYGLNFCPDNVSLAKAADLIFLAVKPFILPGVLREISPYLSRKKILISMAAGVSIKEIGELLSDESKIIRIMPNLCASVKAGMTSLTANPLVTDEEKSLVSSLLSTCSLVDEIAEDLIPAATIVGGASPAYLAMAVEALADGIVRQGLSRDKAYLYLAQSLIGTGKLILDAKLHPAEIKDRVSSPKGVTIEGVAFLESAGFRDILIELVDHLRSD